MVVELLKVLKEKCLMFKNRNAFNKVHVQLFNIGTGQMFMFIAIAFIKLYFCFLLCVLCSHLNGSVELNLNNGQYFND